MSLRPAPITRAFEDPEGFVSGFTSQDSAPQGITWPESGAELISMMGHGSQPTSLWRFTQSSGTVQDLQAANNDLSPSGGVVQGELNALLSSVVARFADNDPDDRLTGPDALDVGAADSLAILLAIVLTGDTPNTRLLGKSNANPGYWIDTGSNGALIFKLHDGTNQNNETVAADHRDVVTHVLAILDRNADLVQLHTQLGSSAGSSVLVGDLTNAIVWIMGQVNLNAAGFDVAMGAVWIGASAEGLGITNLTNLRSAQGF